MLVLIFLKDSIVNIFRNKSVIGTDFLLDVLYKLDLNFTCKSNYFYVHDDNIDIKRDIIKENYLNLWYSRLVRPIKRTF